MAITDGRHPAHLVKVEDSSLYRLGVVDLTADQTLYPIGAGDSVAAGTLAAWLSLRSEDSTRSPLENNCRKALSKWRDDIDLDVDDDSLRDVLAAFAFGLSCGSASCLQQENSVIDSRDVLELFGKMPRPTSC